MKSCVDCQHCKFAMRQFCIQISVSMFEWCEDQLHLNVSSACFTAVPFGMSKNQSLRKLQRLRYESVQLDSVGLF